MPVVETTEEGEPEEVSFFSVENLRGWGSSLALHGILLLVLALVFGLAAAVAVTAR